MKKAPLVSLLIVGFGGLSCGGAESLPQENEILPRLERRTMERGVGRRLRSQLFFLWGQELAARSRSAGQEAPGPAAGQAPAKAEDPSAMREGAIHAFLKVVELDAGLVRESRHNLEILFREEQDQNRQNQDQQNQDKEKQENQKQDKGNQDKGNEGQGSQKDQEKDSTQKDDQGQDRDGQGGGQESPSRAEASEQREGEGEAGQEPRDLSSLVREREMPRAVERALRDERERMMQKQEGSAGALAPVREDW